MTRPSSSQRLARLLAIVPWVQAQEGPTVAQVCQRFGLNERDLLADLNLLFMCGVYPFTPDALIEVDIEDGRVWVRYADWFRRPLRLSAPEGLALLAAARAMSGLAGPEETAGGGQALPSSSLGPDGGRPSPLARAAAKLESVLGTDGPAALDVELGQASPQVMAVLQAALAEGRKVRLGYYSFGRDEASERVVQPWRLFSSEGNWYLLAWCESVGGRRLFRVDRAQAAVALEERFEPPTEIGDVPLYQARPDDPVVVIDLPPEARWVAERYPHEGVTELANGYLRAHLRASSKAWLERLLLRAGPRATVVSGADGVAAAAATRVLATYGTVPSKAWP